VGRGHRTVLEDTLLESILLSVKKIEKGKYADSAINQLIQPENGANEQPYCI
jgi:hypothetical protein